MRTDFFETGCQTPFFSRHLTFDIPFLVLAIGQSTISLPTGRSINK